MSAPVQFFGFSYGQLDPDLVARTDLETYYKGALSALNVAPLAAGGVTIRPGTVMDCQIDQLAGGVRLVEFEGDSGSYLLAFCSMEVFILKGGVRVWHGSTPFGNAHLGTLDFSTGGDTILIFHADFHPKKLVRQGLDGHWLLSDIDFSNIPTFTNLHDVSGKLGVSGKTGKILLTSDHDDFYDVTVQESDTPGTIVEILGRHGPIVEKLSDKQVYIQLVDDLKDTTPVQADDWSLQNVCWSDADGWPSRATFHGDRLFSASNQSRPRTIWGSSSGKYFSHYYTYESLSDEAVEVSLLDRKANKIVSLYSAAKLFAFTTGGPFVFTESPLEPSNFYAQRQAEIGSAAIRPCEVDGVVVFVSDGIGGNSRKSIYELVPNDLADAWTLNDLAVMASKVVKSPIDMATRRGDNDNSAAYLYVVNSDGTLAVLHSQRSRKVTAWVPWSTNGKILAAAVSGNICYLVVQRGTRCFIEHFSSARRGDCSLTASSSTPKTVWGGLGSLSGYAIQVIGDGAAMGLFQVVDGQVTLPYPVTEIEASIPFDWRLETMPVESQLSNGTLVGSRSRIYRTSIKVRDTRGVYIDGRQIDFRRFKNTVLDQDNPNFTGEITTRRLGRDQTRTVVVSGTSMVPATILSVTAWVAS